MLRLHWWDKVPHVEIRHRAHRLSMEAFIAERSDGQGMSFECRKTYCRDLCYMVY